MNSDSVYVQIGTQFNHALSDIQTSPSLMSMLFTELDREHGDCFRSLIRRIIGRSEDITDIMQNAFIRVFNNLHCYDGTNKFATWVYAIAHNLAVDHIRKPFHHREICLDIDSDQGVQTFRDLTPSPERVVSTRYDLPVLLKCVSSTTRDMLVRHADGDSLDLLAKEHGVPVGTVKSRLYRAREKILRQHPSRSPNIYKTLL